MLKGVSLRSTTAHSSPSWGRAAQARPRCSTGISCYIPADSGSITLRGEELARLDEDALAKVRNRKLGFVFQDFLLLDGLTVRDNILLPRIIAGDHTCGMEADADSLCDVFGIAGIKDKYPAEISGGEKQRTAVARALINHPLLILADEPTGNLDSKSSRAVIDSFFAGARRARRNHFHGHARFVCRLVLRPRGDSARRRGLAHARKRRAGARRLSGCTAGRHPGNVSRIVQGEVILMKTFSEVYAALRRQNRGRYGLLAGCCFFSVLLITAYACMMRAPTILTILPEGGDSRKQVMMVFVLAVLGCAVFTTYAAGLFFPPEIARDRHFPRPRGLAPSGYTARWGGSLRSSRCSPAPRARRWARRSRGASGSCFAFFWSTHRRCPSFLTRRPICSRLRLQPMWFACCFLLAARFIRHTNIIDIVQTSHKSEPIHAVKRWYGPVGIVLALAGALLGYLMPTFFVTVLHWYAPGAVNAIFTCPRSPGCI